MSTPATIILFDPAARLDALLLALQGASQRARAHGTEEAWDKAADAWYAVADELMHQLNHPAPKTVTETAQINAETILSATVDFKAMGWPDNTKEIAHNALKDSQD